MSVLTFLNFFFIARIKTLQGKNEILQHVAAMVSFLCQLGLAIALSHLIKQEPRAAAKAFCGCGEHLRPASSG